MLNVSQFIADEYGSKKGLLRYILFGLKNSFGVYKSASELENLDIKRLVFICSGNICRSPFGEVVSHSLNFPAVSYGLHCRGGDPAFEKSINIASELGYDLTEHRSQNIKDYVQKDGDLLIVMEPAHLIEIESLLPQSQKILIGILSDKKTVYLHDPYNTNHAFFKKCLLNIEIATKNLVKSVEAK